MRALNPPTDVPCAGREPCLLELPACEYWWCACGRSRRQPFCDGSHKGTEFAPLKVEIKEAKNVAWCGCKHSGNGAFCDGTHGTL
jgi:CDGSH iron-sulfur domain-containing protein 3